MQPWIVKLWPPCIFLLFFFIEVNAVRLDRCKAKIANATGQSTPANITYLQCVEICGGGPGEFEWTIFSHGFSAWLLPWFALIFQLPFGATDRLDNLVSVFMAIGSPALAGYSLAVTRLNSRWLSDQFRYLNYPNKDHIPLAISALQHIPFRIDTSGSPLPSLIVLHQNNRYWKGLGMAARRTRQWSIPMAMNIGWVLVAFLLTIVDSFLDFDRFITVPGGAGYSTAAVWTYLLPLVIGWLHVGCQPDADHLHNALNDAHAIAYVATITEPALATRVLGCSARAIEFSRHLDHVNADEKKTAPIFNYSRVFIWSQNAEHILKLYENAASKADRKIPVRRREWIDNGDDTIADLNRIGNEAQVIQYCIEEAPFDQNPVFSSPQIPTPLTPYPAFPQSSEPSDVTFLITGTDANTVHRRFPSASSKYDDEPTVAEIRAVPEKPVFATGVFLRVVFAAVLGLGLQWGTTGASILIHLNSPPKGLGCRALTFIVYGAAATVAFLLLLFSSIVSHPVRHQSACQKQSTLKALIVYIAMFTRWLGKLIAILNGFGILLSCIMKFAGAYDNCFCSSTIFGGNPNGLVLFVEENIKGSEVYRYWIGGIIMAFGLSGIYTFAIYVATPMG